MRNYRIDNLKAFLIFCVVFGHLCELTEFAGSSYLYLLIYTFHMPAFVFCTGRFADFNPSKIVKNLIYPYLVFQTLYILFAQFVLQKDMVMQYTKPYWLLWYLFATIIWYCTVPFLKMDNTKRKLAIMAVTIVMALVAGYDDSVSYYLSVSRILVMYPFFVAGYYIKHSKRCEQLGQRLANSKWSAILLGIMVSIAGIGLYLKRDLINKNWLYESYSYADKSYSLWIRAIFIGIAFLFILFLLNITPNKKLPLLTSAGQNTLPIFLLHGFLMKLMEYFKLFQYVQNKALLVFALSCCLVLIFSSKPIQIMFKPLMKWPFHHRRVTA